MLNSPVLKDINRLILIYKAGFDDATSESVYKQQSDDTSKLYTDESLFITCLVPLKLYVSKMIKSRLFGEIRNHRQLVITGPSVLNIEKNQKK